MREPIQQPAASIDNTFPLLLKGIDELNRNIVRMQQRRITVYVNEYLYTQNDVSLFVPSRSRSSVHITGLLATFTSNATITVGAHVLSFLAAQSPVSLMALSWVLNADEVRKITQATVGAMGLELFGEELGDVGVM